MANMQMLELVKSFFGNIGNISKHKSDNTLRYTVGGVSNCKIIQTHFLNYPLLTYKLVYFHLWSIVLETMGKGEHLSSYGLLKIVGIKAQFKMGLSKLLLASFPSYTPTIRPDFDPNLSSMNISWLCGFMSADGHFGLRIRKHSKLTLGFNFEPVISISQDGISLITLEYIAKILGMGKVIKDSPNRTTYMYYLASLKNINHFINKIEVTDIIGQKALDFADFCKGIEIINSKGHLTQEGLNELKTLSSQMNAKRTNFEKN
nr:hypothetical protein [Ganoderma lingzhi]